MNELALFAGAGGGILGGQLLGWTTVGAVEIEKYPREVLLQRQRDGILKPFPIWDDITTFDGRPWKGSVDIVTGGFPCQDISAAGKGVGITGERSGLWGEMARVINEIRPRFALVENSPMLTSRGLGTVLGNLAEMGYDARWCVLGADDIGARHRRKRIWILAYSKLYGLSGSEIRGSFEEAVRQQQEGEDRTQHTKGTSNISETKRNVGYSNQKRLEREERTGGLNKKGRKKQDGCTTEPSRISYWDTDPADIPDTISDSEGPSHREGVRRDQQREQEQDFSKGSEIRSDIRDSNRIGSAKPRMGRVAHGLPRRVDKLKALGNAQVPGVASTAFIILSGGLI